jgi:hypothetical protein
VSSTLPSGLVQSPRPTVVSSGPVESGARVPSVGVSTVGPRTDPLDLPAALSGVLGLVALVLLVLPVAWLAAPLVGLAALAVAAWALQRPHPDGQRGHVVAVLGAVLGAVAVSLGLAVALVVASLAL